MKKQYEKPMLAVEYYMLSQSIAACATKIGFQNSECVIKDPDATNTMKDLASSDYFVEVACAAPPTGMDQYDSIC
ncbi:MAG: hypothetical protein PUC59_08565, partial [Firmicutes bacterium]|nr:hypothetical protein [Bacillota bacterium]